MHNLHNLKDIVVDAFEIPKAEFQNDGKFGGWFSPLQRHGPQMRLHCHFRNYTNKYTQ